MDDTTLQDLENELKALRPRRPSVLLRARVEHDLGQAEASESASVTTTAERRYTTATTLRSWKWMSWQMAAAAGLILATTLLLWRWQSSATQSISPVGEQPIARADTSVDEQRSLSDATEPRSTRTLATRDTYRPVRAANVLYDLADEGPTVLEDNTPARRVRARYLDTYTWKNPATNASLKWSVPRDEVRVLPASFQ